MTSLTKSDFARLFNVAECEFDDECHAYMQKANFEYREMNTAERDRTLLEILKRLDTGNFQKAGKEGKARWDKGWTENLNNFVESNYDPRQLIPKYVRPDQPLRLFQNYITSKNDYFELDFYTILRLWLFKNYCRDCRTIYEFACGPAYNVYMLAKLYPDKKIWGLDWAVSAVNLVNLLATKFDMNVVGRTFNMFSPDDGFALEEDSVVATLGGLEQLGADFQPFIKYLLGQSPKTIIHIEPLYEMYDEDSLADYLAMKFHSQRNYLLGLLPFIRELEKNGEVVIHKIQRMYFGSLYHDGWSMIIYSPRKK
jgi:hypothetical protein